MKEQSNQAKHFAALRMTEGIIHLNKQCYVIHRIPQNHIMQYKFNISL